MPSFVTATVAAVLVERPGLQRVRLDDGSPRLVLTELTGPVAAGDEVVVNTTAVELGPGHRRLARRALEPGPAGLAAGGRPGTS